MYLLVLYTSSIVRKNLKILEYSLNKDFSNEMLKEIK